MRRPLPASGPRIVRVEAGRIRDKLARFYEGEGVAGSFRMVLPVGGYLPQFRQREFVPPPSRQGRALAVSPFANLAGDPDTRPSALGLADQLIDTLGRVPGLKMVARLSAAVRAAGSIRKRSASCSAWIT